MPVGHGMSRRQVDEAKAKPSYVSCRVVKALRGLFLCLFYFGFPELGVKQATYVLEPRVRPCYWARYNQMPSILSLCPDWFDVQINYAPSMSISPASATFSFSARAQHLPIW